jgi:hypothetical protein
MGFEFEGALQKQRALFCLGMMGKGRSVADLAHTLSVA